MENKQSTAMIRDNIIKKSISEIWWQYDACELTIKDTDGLLLWHGEFEDMPIKYINEIIVYAMVDDYNAEILIVVEA